MSKATGATAHLAIDLGASSGRAMLGVLRDRSRVSLHELHRFDHHARPTPSGPVWDLTGIWGQILTGLEKGCRFAEDEGVPLRSVGVDAWGVDWALLGRTGELIGLPHCYRDPANELGFDSVLRETGGFSALYRRTGIQKMAINTLFQVATRWQQDPGLFEAARHLIFLPDLFHYWLSGKICTERTIASTSSMLSIETGDWDRKLLKQLNLPTHLLGPIIDPGSFVGGLRQELIDSLQAPPDLQVIAPASHDTASAVAAAPAAAGSSWAYLSSGTWSLLGVERERPLVNKATEQIPLTNELGVAGTVRLLKNISGLWLVQELRRELNQADNDLEYTFDDLTEAARLAEPYRTLVDPNAAPFQQPGQMSAKLRQFAADTGQPQPETVGDLVRCCLDSLALCYRETLESLEEATGERCQTLHLVGGGIQNGLLNELTAETVARPVLCGPVEATALGNVLVQAMGTGELHGLAGVREVVRNSIELVKIKGVASDRCETAYRRYRQLKSP